MAVSNRAAAGKINIGDARAGLDILTSVPTEEEEDSKGRTQTYSLLPQNKFSNVITPSANIAKVGVEVGNTLNAQGTAASDVSNVFEDYFKDGSPSLEARGNLPDTVYRVPQFRDKHHIGFPIDILPNPPNQIIDDLNNQYLFDPGGVGPDSGYSDWSDDAPNLTLGEAIEGMGTGISDLFGFVTTAAPSNVVNNMVQNAARVLSGREPISLEETNPFIDATASRAQEAIDSFVSDSDAQNATAQTQSAQDQAQAAVEGMDSPNVGDPSDPGGPGDGPGDPGDVGNVGMLASGGTVKAKAKKVPSFMDSK